MHGDWYTGLELAVDGDEWINTTRQQGTEFF
jgi:hypothetical protein